MMSVFSSGLLQKVAMSVMVLLTCYFMIFCHCPEKGTKHVDTQQKPRLLPQSPLPKSGPCNCYEGSTLLKNKLPKDQYEELLQRRAKELQQFKIRTTSVLSTPLFALPNSPLQYPIQGFHVQPLISTPVPGDGMTKLIMESSSLVILNYLLAKVFYTSTIYHIHTGDLVSFQFEEHEAVFPITIKQPLLPVLYNMGTSVSSHVTVITKTFLRYPQLKVLLSSIRRFYSDIEVIIADDSFETEHITGEHIRQYIMPPAQGWFAGRNLAVSQVTTKYFLWVDDDFEFTEGTKIEKLVEVMEAHPELDVVGGTVKGNQFYFSLLYDEGEEMEGGCLYRKSKGRFHSLSGYPKCFMASGVVNFFLARTQAAQQVGFDPKLQRVAHSEFFIDGLGSLMVATYSHVSIGHQPKFKHYQMGVAHDKIMGGKLLIRRVACKPV